MSDLGDWLEVPEAPGQWEAQGTFADDRDDVTNTPAIADVRVIITRREPVTLPFSWPRSEGERKD